MRSTSGRAILQALAATEGDDRVRPASPAHPVGTVKALLHRARRYMIKLARPSDRGD